MLELCFLGLEDLSEQLLEQPGTLNVLVLQTLFRQTNFSRLFLTGSRNVFISDNDIRHSEMLNITFRAHFSSMTNPDKSLDLNILVEWGPVKKCSHLCKG